MATSITIRNVPEEVGNELASRAALCGRSLQEYLLAELTELARRPSPDAWLARVRERKQATRSRVSSKQILTLRDKDRR